MTNFKIKDILDIIYSEGVRLERIVVEYEDEGFTSFREFKAEMGDYTHAEFPDIFETLQIWCEHLHLFVKKNIFICSNNEHISGKIIESLEKLGLKYVSMTPTEYDAILDSEARVISLK